MGFCDNRFSGRKLPGIDLSHELKEALEHPDETRPMTNEVFNISTTIAQQHFEHAGNSTMDFASLGEFDTSNNTIQQNQLEPVMVAGTSKKQEAGNNAT